MKVLFEVELKAIFDLLPPLLLEFEVHLKLPVLRLELDTSRSDDVYLLLGLEINDPHGVETFVGHDPSIDQQVA